MSQTLQFQVTNLNCAGCAGRAERAIASVDGVQNTSVNLATHMASATLTQQNFSEILNALEHAGYPAKSETFRLTIEGMTCATCARRVEDAISQVPYVTEASVNFATNVATVSVPKNVVSAKELIRAVAKVGYVARAHDAQHTHDTDHLKTAQALQKDVILSAVLTLPIFVVEMGGHMFPSVHHFITATIGQQLVWTISCLLAALILAFPGRVFLTKGLPALMRGTPEMNTLVAIGTLAAFSYSFAVIVLKDAFSAQQQVVYFETVGVIVTLILFGRWLEHRAKTNAGSAITSLLNLAPKSAWHETETGQQSIPVSQIEIGYHLRAKAGDQIAVDGTVVSDGGYINQSMLNGEPLPVAVQAGDQVFAGTLLVEGTLLYRAEKIGKDTALGQIIDTVEKTQATKLPIQKYLDVVIRVFVPIILAISALTFLAWIVFAPEMGVRFALVNAISVIIIACPCAIGLATPVSVLVATGRAARHNILFRSGEALQNMSQVQAIALDKTGTLTSGQPVLMDHKIFLPKGIPALQALQARSQHPLAKAILSGLHTSKDALHPEIENYKTLHGRGVTATINKHHYAIGSQRMMDEDGVDLSSAYEFITNAQSKGYTLSFAARDNTLIAAFACSDEIKADARKGLQDLRDRGITLAMVTGDQHRAAHHVAENLGIDKVYAELLPKQKAHIVQELQDTIGQTAFVGDGINDAPALVQADTGIAMGHGTEIAVQSGEIVLSKSDISSVAIAFDISRKTMRNIRQNVFWAFAYNTCLIPVAAGLFYPSFGLLLSPMFAAAAMAFSSVFVVTNALRLSRI